jgi:ubiquinol-cytochrome c reductase cytochrome b subunit
VIVNLFDAIPVIGPKLAIWIRGDYVVSDATLNRFFAFHVIAVPLALVGLVAAHILALHEVGSNNPDGVEIKKTKDPRTGLPLDGIPFHPYYTVKDGFGASVFLVVFFIVVFFLPEMGGYFLEANNFIPADSLKTPPHIAPVWYFTPYYSILRATTENFVNWGLAPATVVLALLVIWAVKRTAVRAGVAALTIVLLAGFFTLEAKVWGVVLMGVSVMSFFLLPWLDRSPVRSIRYKGPMYKIALALFVIAFFVLGYLGTLAPTETRTVIAQIGTAVYFMFFALMPWYSRFDKYKPEPERVTWK